MGITLRYGYFGVFSVSLLSGISIFFPVPDTLVIFTLSGLKAGNTWDFDILMIAAVAGIGAAIGELSGYLIGLGGRKTIIKKYKKKIDFLERVFKKFGPVAIFAFAFTPLPDDLVFIPLGMMRYNVVKALTPAFIGKFCMYLVVASAGRFLVPGIAEFLGADDWLDVLVITSLGIIAFILMFKVDWEKYLDKYLN
jgi:membrane protein DedA with SNARE-associated domain